MRYLYSQIISFVVSFSLVLSLVPAPVGAQSVEELSRLIADLQAQLLTLQSTTTTTTTAPSTSSLTYGCTDLRSYPSMYQGSSDATTRGGVTILQTFLARDPEIYPEGIKTGYFGLLTKLAVQRFQTKYGVATLGMPGYGYVGPITKNKIYSLSCLTDTSIPGTGSTDTTKPEVTIAQPTALTTVPFADFTISGSVKDALGASDIAAVAVKIVDTRAGTNLVRNATINTSLNYPTNGHPWSLKVLESWINPGATLDITVSATDKSGNQSAAVTRRIYVSSGAVRDFAAPSVSISSPGVGVTVSYADGFLAQGSAADGVDGVGVARVEVKVTDSGTGATRTENAVLTSEDTLTNRVAWKFPVPSAWISPSKNVTLSVVAIDYGGRASAPVTRTISVGAQQATTTTLDYTAPTVTIAIPSLSSTVTQVSANGFYVNGTATDNDGGVGIAKVEVSVYDYARSSTVPTWTPVTLQGNSWAYLVPATAITPGAKVRVSARAMDQRGNVSLEKWRETTVQSQTVAQPTIFALYDMNKDGLINALDVQYVTDVGVKLKTCPTGMDCDLNNDGLVNATDASLILAAIRGIYDFNGDGKLDGADVQIVADVGVGTRSCPTSKTCDFNRDGGVSATDATMVQNAITSLNAVTSPVNITLLSPSTGLIFTQGSSVPISWSVTGAGYDAYEIHYANSLANANACATDKTSGLCVLPQSQKNMEWVVPDLISWASSISNYSKAELAKSFYLVALALKKGSPEHTVLAQSEPVYFSMPLPNNDTTIPRLSISSPVNGATVTLANPAVIGTATDEGGSGLNRLEWVVSNVNLNIEKKFTVNLSGNSSSFDTRLPISSEEYGHTINVSILVFDNAGNKGNPVTFSVKVENAPATPDTTRPTTVEIIDPLGGATVTYEQGFAAMVRAIDNTGGSGIKNVRVSILNNSTSAGDQYAANFTGNNIWSVQIPQTKLTYGAPIQIVAEAFDNAGNSKLTSPTLVTVEAAPAPTSPECSDGKNNDTEDNLIDSADPGCRSTGDIDESNPTPVPTLFKINDRVVTTLNVITRNIAGGSTTYGTKNIGDVGTVIGGPKFHRFDNYDHWWWNVKFDTGSSGWVIQNGLKIAAVVTADTTKPTVDITDPVANQTITKANGLAVQGTAADNHTGASGIDHIKVSVFSSATNSAITQNVQLSTNNAWFAQLQSSQLAYGATLTISAQAVDKAGNPSLIDEVIVKVSSEPITTASDTTKPTVSISEPRAVYPYPAYLATNFTVKGTAGDTGGSGLAKVLVSIFDYSRNAVTVNEAVATLSSGSWSYKVPASAVTVANKAHILAVAVDGSGNRSTTFEAQANILVDTSGKSPVWIYDLSGDSIANQNDITLLNNVLLGSAACPAGKSCDFTGDFVVTNTDKTKLIQLIRAMYDLDSSGTFNATDVQIVTNVAAGTRTCPTGKTCDFNQSGTVNATDANIANNALANMPVAASSDDAAALAALLASAQALLAQLIALMGQ